VTPSEVSRASRSAAVRRPGDRVAREFRARLIPTVIRDQFAPPAGEDAQLEPPGPQAKRRFVLIDDFGDMNPIAASALRPPAIRQPGFDFDVRGIGNGGMSDFDSGTSAPVSDSSE